MLDASRHNKSILLVSLFFVWVLCPFVALLIAERISTRWTPRVRLALYGLMLLITAGSLGSYWLALIPGRTKPAGFFLVVPLISLLAIGIFTQVAAFRSRRSADGRSKGNIN
jgi:hypothetical protein